MPRLRVQDFRNLYIVSVVYVEAGNHTFLPAFRTHRDVVEAHLDVRSILSDFLRVKPRKIKLVWKRDELVDNTTYVERQRRDGSSVRIYLTGYLMQERKA